MSSLLMTDKIVMGMGPVMMAAIFKFGTLSEEKKDRTIAKKGPAQAINPFLDFPPERGVYYVKKSSEIELRSRDETGVQNIGSAGFQSGVRRSRFGKSFDESQCGILWLDIHNAFKDKGYERGLLSETIKQLEANNCTRIEANLSKLPKSQVGESNMESLLLTEGFKPKPDWPQVYVRDSFEPGNKFEADKRRRLTHTQVSR
eukprot:CAMPEP_0172495300 /NCGR_PEP_ID=MMETSP1066-20121228/67176_1 /TAXON_ID=671091 /ORGANISM="Coscinodiscus wailesii, Strain CCMP2513" /LENGTH=201 /DNA_ID=CAMNT_0013266877 /DNA_START=53 /DNA_END=658 /DNA_ORIENTATION=+